MAEFKLNPPTNTRGFYVRMKFSHQHKHGRATQQQQHFFCRNFKWVICSFLSLYLLTTLLITTTTSGTHKTTTSLSRTTVSHRESAFQSRALVESSNPISNPDSLKDLKVYIYELPSKYNSDWLSNERCSKHLFASEVAIHKALSGSDFRTFDPYDADFFFVPVYVSCNFSTVNGFPAIGHARSLISSAVELISTTLPFWNRSGGSDHVFVASHDFGSCFHTLEDVAMADGIPEILKRSMILQTFAVEHKHPCQEVKHVVIPPYIPPESLRSTLEKWPLNGRRDIFAFFRGKMEVHPKNVSGRFYSKAVRTIIWKKFNNDRRFYLRRDRFAGYQSEIVRSTFCLCPLGWAPWSPRLVESVAVGCVPVIIADGIRLPFPDAVPWPEISVRVSENDVSELGTILEHVAKTNISTIRKKLGDPAVRKALLFHDPIQQGDATWQVLNALARELDRSHSRQRLLVASK
ncbi:Probable glucuronoxylan glucuronosyltransferase irx7 [Ancistrocladus abbreviatus]